MKILQKKSYLITTVKIFLITIVFIYSDTVKADWLYVGNPGFGAGETTTHCLVFSNNKPFIVSGGSVMEFDGTNWNFVGSPNFFNGNRSTLSFSDSTPYISFIDNDHNSKVSVMKFNGSDWVNVGNPGFSEFSCMLYVQIEISDGQIYVAFIEGTSNENRKVSVMKFDGMNWNYVGSPRFNAGIYTNWLCLAVNNSIPYVTFVSTEMNVILERVMYINGLTWVNLGQVNFVNGFTEYNQITFCKTSPYENVPYLAFGVSDYSRVMRYEGQEWVNVGTPAFGDLGLIPFEHSLALSGITPYIACKSNGIKVAKWNGDNWIQIGQNFGQTSWPCLVINNETPYLAIPSDGGVSVFKYQDTILPLDINLSVLMEGLYNPIINQLMRKDSVTVYLRDTFSPFTIRDSARSFIDSVNLSGTFIFPDITTGTYYMTVKHFNSVETWSRDGGEYLINDGSIFNYNFTNNRSMAYGNNLKLIGNKYCMFSGDIDNDGYIILSDVIRINNDASEFVTGSYLISDLTGDGFVDLTDVSLCYNNASNFVAVIRP